MFESIKRNYLTGALFCLTLSTVHAVAQSPKVVTTGVLQGFNGAHDIAVDANYDIFIANTNAGTFLQDSLSGSSITLASGLTNPTGDAVDTNGNAYVGTTDGHLYEIPVGGGTAVDLLSTTGCMTTTQSFVAPLSIAVDGTNNVYFAGQSAAGPPANTSGEYIYEISPAGACSILIDLSAFGKDVYHIASDAAGNITFAFSGGTQIYSLPLGSTTPTILNAAFTAINGLRADTYGNVYVSDASTIDEIPFDNSAGALAPSRIQAVLQSTSVSAVGIGPANTILTTDGSTVYLSNRETITVLAANSETSGLNQTGDIVYSGVGNSQPTASLGGMAFDSSGNTWSANSGEPVLEETGYLATTSTPVTGGGLSAPVSVAVDGQNNILVANNGNGSFSVFTDTGVAQSGTSGFGTASLTQPSAIAIDMAGGVWITNSKPGQDSVTHILGGAYPVITPLVSGVANDTLGVEP